MATTSQPLERAARRTETGERRGGALKMVALYTVLTLIGLFFITPLLWMLVTALKPDAEWIQPNWIPRDPTSANFQKILNNPQLPVFKWLRNSALVALVFTLLTLALDAMAGYAYGRLRFPGRNFIFGLLVATLVMPGIIFLVPNYLTVAGLPLLGLGTYQSLILPGLAGVFGVFFMRQFFQGIPRELEEAAYIDGATTFQTFWKVALPLSVPALSTLAIITFLASWNDFLWPLLILGNDREKMTLPVGLSQLQGQAVYDFGGIMAGALVTAVPVLLLYLFLQRYIIASVAMTGLKG
jgi:multiple sugar transport system permease protein